MMNFNMPPDSLESRPLLQVRDLTTEFMTDRGIVRALNGVSFSLDRGETLGLVGESGSGKSVTALSIMRLITEPVGRIASGEIWFDGRDLTQLSDSQMRQLRGREVALIFQDAMSSLNPVLTVGRQITETLRTHLGLTPDAARTRAVELLNLVGIPDPAKRLSDYPHQFSGGMRQRVMIAMALSCEPKLLIADEPTTALDVTIQAQIVELLQRLREELGMSMIMITHDLGVVARIADRVNVMYAGSIVESGFVDDIFDDPQHPYTRGLLASIPRVDTGREEELRSIPGLPPNLLEPPLGCAYQPRCDVAFAKCEVNRPPLVNLGNQHCSACWLSSPNPDNIESPMNTAARSNTLC
jgi:oligopeptide transport system ATP-binding protein